MTNGEVEQILRALGQVEGKLDGAIKRLDRHGEEIVILHRKQDKHEVEHARREGERGERNRAQREGFTVSWRLVGLGLTFLGAIAGAAAAGNGIATAVLR